MSAVRDSIVYGRAEFPTDAGAAAFLLEATVRREFPYITDEAFEAMTPEELRYHLAFIEGMAEGHRVVKERTKG